MASRYNRFALILAATSFCLPVMVSAQATPKRSAGQRPVKQEPATPTPQQPDPPSAPPTLEQMPASVPQVTFHNGQLTIIATNSTLGDILRAVRAETGASVEIPGNAMERVAVQLGPGPARDVLATLLNGSHFNYVMLGSPTDPTVVDKIILTSKAGPGPAGEAEAANSTGNPQTQGILQQAMDAQEDMQDDPAEDANDAENQPDNQPSQAEEQQQQQPNGQPAIKTPEQLLQQLQRQQQIQQQQPPGVPQAVPPPQNPQRQ
jgi:hypothetical protein